MLLSKGIQHRRRNISVVMDNPPSSGFSAIDVRDAMRDSNLLSGKRKVPALDTQFVGPIPGDLNDMIA